MNSSLAGGTSEAFSCLFLNLRCYTEDSNFHLSNMKSILRKKAIEMRRKDRLSYSEIRKRLKVSKSTLSYWLKDYPLTSAEILDLRRKGWQKGEASREKFRETMRKKKEKIFQNIYEEAKKDLKGWSEDALYSAGLMLYLGEGDKRRRDRISLTNTDPTIVKFFIKWAGNFLSIPKDRFRVQLHLYKNMDLEEKENFWLKQLSLDRSQLYKTQVRELNSNSPIYFHPSYHGTCQVVVSDTIKKTKLSATIQALLDMYNDDL